MQQTCRQLNQNGNSTSACDSCAMELVRCQPIERRYSAHFGRHLSWKAAQNARHMLQTLSGCRRAFSDSDEHFSGCMQVHVQRIRLQALRSHACRLGAGRNWWVYSNRSTLVRLWTFPDASANHSPSIRWVNSVNDASSTNRTQKRGQCIPQTTIAINYGHWTCGSSHLISKSNYLPSEEWRKWPFSDLL